MVTKSDEELMREIEEVLAEAERRASIRSKAKIVCGDFLWRMRKAEVTSDHPLGQMLEAAFERIRGSSGKEFSGLA